MLFYPSALQLGLYRHGRNCNMQRMSLPALCLLNFPSSIEPCSFFKAADSDSW